MTNKKADITLETIIIFVILLIVFIIVAYYFVIKYNNGSLDLFNSWDNAMKLPKN